jgi:hypothetical protein
MGYPANKLTAYLPPLPPSHPTCFAAAKSLNRMMQLNNRPPDTLIALFPQMRYKRGKSNRDLINGAC